MRRLCLERCWRSWGDAAEARTSPAPVEQASDVEHEDVSGARLRNELVGAGEERGVYVRTMRTCSEDDDRDVRHVRAAAPLLEHEEPVTVGKAAVEHDGVGHVRSDGLR